MEPPPHSRNPEKQKRYEKYLVCVRNKREDALSLLQPQNMTEWEREREKVGVEREKKTTWYCFKNLCTRSTYIVELVLT